MKYYCKQLSLYTPKNNLHGEAQRTLADLDGLVFEDPDRLTEHLAKKIDALNLKHRQAKPLKVVANQKTNTELIIEVRPTVWNAGRNVIEFAMYPIKGFIFSSVEEINKTLRVELDRSEPVQ